jgi:hypothetical protein
MNLYFYFVNNDPKSIITIFIMIHKVVSKLFVHTKFLLRKTKYTRI